MAKEFSFRGKDLQELQAMSIEEFAGLVNSRARRSLQRGFDKKLLKDVDKALEIKKSGKFPKPIRTHKRDAVILPVMVGLQFAVYNGKSFEIVEVTQEMLGHYLGEFSLTRKWISHGKAGIGATRSSTAIASKK